MPNLTEHQSQSTTKGLFLGDSGAGKTGALVSLARAGYNLRIMDFDNGVDIIVNILRKGIPPNIPPAPHLLSKINSITLTDTFRAAGMQIIPTSANAWSRAVGLLDKWEDLGPVVKFSTEDILIIDSLNFAGRAAMRFIQQLNGRLASPAQIQDYRDGQQLVESLLQFLYSEAVKCNVLCLSHIREVGKQKAVELTNSKGELRIQMVEDPDTVKGYAETGAGRALSPTVGRYFNAVLMADIVGSGLATRRVIRTQPHLNIGLKNSAPGVVKPEYPLDSGLADYFVAVRGPVKALLPLKQG